MKLYGKNPVFERLKSNPKTIKKITIQEGFSDASYVRKKAKKWSIPVCCVSKSKMLKMTRSINSQGILVEVDEFFYTSFEELCRSSVRKNHSLLFLDGLTDPQNFGSIIRSLACLGGFSVVIPKHDSVQVTEAVLRVASGGDNFIAISKVANLNAAIKQAKEVGFWIAGAVAQGGQDLMRESLPMPISIVIGSEQKGIRDVIKKVLDIELTIPMKQARLSMNAAQAATIFCYEITKQKKKKGK